jgi:aspartyl-tRNA(Asn)/glutamyl-tRNA(Gln) amidotransferase subunit A
MLDMIGLTLSAASDAIKARRISPLEMTQQCLSRIECSELRAFTVVDRQGALEAAKALTAEWDRGSVRGPLHGIPLAYKDLFFIEGLPTTCGTGKHDYFTAERTATVVRRLSEAGAVTLGKLNMTELAMGPFGDNPHHGDVRNPWALDRSAGGSSSGSAAAVAAGLALGALGSDTGGSIRQPAAYCGIVGLKPTYGRVSRAGAMPLSWSLDHVGPMARTVRDVALLFQVIAGHDPLDPTTSAANVEDFLHGIERPIDGVRVGVPRNYYWDGLEPEIETAVRGATDAISALGAKLADVDLPDPKVMNAISTVIARSEGTAVHGAFSREHPRDLQPATNARLELGYQISATDYLQATRLRVQLAREFLHDVFSRVDVLVTPVVPDIPPVLNTVTAGGIDALLEQIGRVTQFTRPLNGLGLPAISVPCGVSKSGLPLAYQLVGRPFDEMSLFQVAHRYEQSFNWWERFPAPLNSTEENER